MKLNIRVLALILIFSFLFDDSLNAKIINVLPFPGSKNKEGFKGKLALTFEDKAGNTDLLGGSAGFSGSYFIKEQLFLLSLAASLKKSEGNEIEKNSFSHLRYRFYFNDIFSWEVLTQLENDRFKKLKYRGLLGSGPRVEKKISGNFGADFGIAALIEWEKIDAIMGERVNYRDYRLSSYFGLAYKVEKNAELRSRFFFQPLFNEFEDYKVFFQTTLSLSFNKKFSVFLTYNLIGDSNPPGDVKNWDRAFKTGLNISF